MFDGNKLKAKIAENGLTQERVCSLAGISRATFARRMVDGEFKVGELSALIRLLKIKEHEIAPIFFADTVSKMRQRGE